MSKPKREFVSQLSGLADGSFPPGKGSTQLMETFLEFGSQTDDNLNCYRHIEYGLVPGETCRPKETYGLKLKGTNILVSDVIHLIEDLDLPVHIKEEFPSITENEWAAVTRMATMILIAFEYESDKTSESGS
jgi:hypothetical protein